MFSEPPAIAEFFQHSLFTAKLLHCKGCLKGQQFSLGCVLGPLHQLNSPEGCWAKLFPSGMDPELLWMLKILKSQREKDWKKLNQRLHIKYRTTSEF